MSPVYNKIYAVGDSHAGTFYSITHTMPTGPNTMYTIASTPKDLIQEWGVATDGLIVFCFGEIDVRCHIHNQIIQKNRLEDEVINTLATSYSNKIKTVDCDIGVMSIVPPARIETQSDVMKNSQYPFIGSDSDRVRYTQKLNNTLKSLCEKYGILYFDIYTLYADNDGHLKLDYSDSDLIHIRDNQYPSYVLKLLNSMENIQKYKI